MSVNWSPVPGRRAEGPTDFPSQKVALGSRAAVTHAVSRWGSAAPTVGTQVRLPGSHGHVSLRPAAGAAAVGQGDARAGGIPPTPHVAAAGGKGRPWAETLRRATGPMSSLPALCSRPCLAGSAGDGSRAGLRLLIVPVPGRCRLRWAFLKPFKRRQRPRGLRGKSDITDEQTTKTATVHSNTRMTPTDVSSARLHSYVGVFSRRSERLAALLSALPDATQEPPRPL